MSKDGELVDTATVGETELLELVVLGAWVLDTTAEVATLTTAVLDLVELGLGVLKLAIDESALLEAWMLGLG